MDGWMDEWMDGQTDKQIGRWTRMKRKEGKKEGQRKERKQFFDHKMFPQKLSQTWIYPTSNISRACLLFILMLASFFFISFLTYSLCSLFPPPTPWSLLCVMTSFWQCIVKLVTVLFEYKTKVSFPGALWMAFLYTHFLLEVMLKYLWEQTVALILNPLYL